MYSFESKKTFAFLIISNEDMLLNWPSIYKNNTMLIQTKWWDVFIFEYMENHLANEYPAHNINVRWYGVCVVSQENNNKCTQMRKCHTFPRNSNAIENVNKPYQHTLHVRRIKGSFKSSVFILLLQQNVSRKYLKDFPGSKSDFYCYPPSLYSYLARTYYF